MIFNIDHNNLVYGNVMFRPFEVGGVQVLRMNAGGGGAATAIDYPINESQWYMATVVMDLDSIWYYVDCLLVGTEVNQGNSSSNGANSAVIGTDRDFSPYYKGLIDDISIFNCAISSTEVCALFNSDITGIDEGSELAVNGFELFPNPAGETISIKIDSYLDYTGRFELIDVLGRIVLVVNIDAGINQVSLNTLSTGQYVYRLTNGEASVHTGKIVKR